MLNYTVNGKYVRPGLDLFVVNSTAHGGVCFVGSYQRMHNVLVRFRSIPLMVYCEILQRVETQMHPVAHTVEILCFECQIL